MNYIDFLKQTTEQNKSIACMGADPVIEKIPIKSGSVEEKISKFYSEIIDAIVSSNTPTGAIKPNYAFYGQYGFEGLRALQNVCEKVRSENIPLILDAKRADIGSTSEAYAKEVFDFWKVDAVTVAPYMGEDSVSPFIKWCEEKGKGVYILNRTSNKGAVDLQNLKVEGKHLFLKVSEKILEWGRNAKGNLGAVVGATSPAEFEELTQFFSGSKNHVPFLIPGVGKQGGSAPEIVGILRKNNSNLAMHRINSSREINYAFEKTNSPDFADAAVKALQELNKEINF